MSEANPILEKAWRQLEEGDFESARASAESAIRADPENPEVLLLFAACLRSEGRGEEALGQLALAAELAPEWSGPEQWIAEILAQDLDRPAEALEHATYALDRADEEDEFWDAIVLKAGLELQLGKVKAAQATLGEIPPAGEVDQPDELSLDLAYLFLEAGLTEEAETRFRILADAHEGDAEAWYGVGLCAEERGVEQAKREAWLRVLDLDAVAALDEPLLGEAEVAEVAEQALGELPEAARRMIAGVPILVVELPARSEVEQGLDPRLLGLFEGTAYSEAATVGGPAQLTRILLFHKNLERFAIDVEDLREQIRITLLHETGHFFGMSEEDLAAVGLE